MPVQFVAHEKDDNVGVVTVEGILAGQKLTGWLMKEDTAIEVETLDDIPIGHQVALADLAPGDSVIRYGQDTGEALAPIRKGELLHARNARSRQSRAPRRPSLS